MSGSESIIEAVAERWLARALEIYPATARASLATHRDPFRDPAGHLLRENLRLLTRQLLGPMNRDAIERSVDAVVRLRAVQNFTASEAIEFVFALRSAAGEIPGATIAPLQERIDQLALIAFDAYMGCREQIYALRFRGARMSAQSGARPE